MDCHVTQQDGTVFFRLTGKVDEEGAEFLKRQFNSLQLPLVKELIIDMRDSSSIGSSGIGKMLLFYKHLAGHHATIRLEHVPRATYELLRELKLHTLFDITTNE